MLALPSVCKRLTYLAPVLPASSASNGSAITITARTNASTQGRHWFSHTMFDVVRYRTERPDIAIGVGLPESFTSYSNLAPKVVWLKGTAPFKFFWVAEDGGVREE